MAKINDFDENDEPVEEEDKGKKGKKEKKEKKEKKDSKPLGLPVIIGIIAGTIILFAVLFRFIFLPMIVDSMSSGSANEHKKETVQKKDEIDEKLIQFGSTGRITTNPRGSSQFVVVDFGIIFYPNNDEATKELKESKGKESGEGSLPPKLLARTKGVVNSVLGSLTVEDLHAIRDSLPSIMKKNLKPIFKEKELSIKDVILQEFIIQ